MASVSLLDHLERLVAIEVRGHVIGGRAKRMRLRAMGVSGPGGFARPDSGLSTLAKAAGATPEQVAAWESGEATPSTGQALAWLHELYRRTPKDLFDHAVVDDEVDDATA